MDALQGIKEDRSGYENESFVVSDSSCREVMDDSVETPDEQPNRENYFDLLPFKALMKEE